jgi:hypothetical protein
MISGVVISARDICDGHTSLFDPPWRALGAF